jgi:hypothetical protein
MEARKNAENEVVGHSGHPDTPYTICIRILPELDFEDLAEAEEGSILFLELGKGFGVQEGEDAFLA